MKKLLALFFTISLVISSSVFSQEFTSDGKSLNIGAGLGLAGLAGDATIPPLSVGLQFGITDKISVGGIVGYAGSSYKFGFLSSSYEWKYSYIIAGLKGKNNIIGFSVLKGGGFLIDNVHNNLTEYCSNVFSNWSINLDYHFGGYAKINKELIKFKDEFEKLNSIPLDYVYTAKMIYGIYDLIKNGYFSSGSSIMALHTGGLQGNAGMENKQKYF